MSDTGQSALLPAGLKDVLPPQAAQEAAVVERLIATCGAFGYERVKPPLLEFEDTLLAGAGQDLAQQTFRLMDPVSQRMMGLRADITPQVARLAATRLANAPRPLRLCYAGQVLQVKGSQLRPERQFGQVGAELIGAPQERADAEVVALAAEALDAVGVADLTIDLTVPTLVQRVAEGLGLAAQDLAAVRPALDRKDEAGVAALMGRHAETLVGLLRASGSADRALHALTTLRLPDAARGDIASLERIVQGVRALRPSLALTIDAVENRGFEYHTGVSFTVFAPRVRGEIGRGGRYRMAALDGERGGTSGAESSTGFTLYMDSILRALPRATAAPRLYLPAAVAAREGPIWRAQGWTTVAGLEDGKNSSAEARRLQCSHALVDGKPVAIEE